MSQGVALRTMWYAYGVVAISATLTLYAPDLVAALTTLPDDPSPPAGSRLLLWRLFQVFHPLLVVACCCSIVAVVCRGRIGPIAASLIGTVAFTELSHVVNKLALGDPLSHSAHGIAVSALLILIPLAWPSALTRMSRDHGAAQDEMPVKR